MIACHNFKRLSSQYVFTEEDQIKVEDLNNYTEDSEPLKLKFVLDHVRNGNYLVKCFYINREWKRAGYLETDGYAKGACERRGWNI